MKLLTFQARRFAWTPHCVGLPPDHADLVATDPQPGAVDEAVVAWLHVEARDAADEARAFKKTLKHIKWVANKRALKSIALHVFAHLGGENAKPAFARDFVARLAERLRNTGYTVAETPFGWFCGWQLDVYGESMAKVFREI